MFFKLNLDDFSMIASSECKQSYISDCFEINGDRPLTSPVQS